MNKYNNEFKDNYKYNARKILEITQDPKEKNKIIVEKNIGRNETKHALSEVNDILHHIDKKLYDKIPSKMIQIIEENRDIAYTPNIDYTKSINEQQLLKETRIILSLLYRDYICSPEKKIELTENDIMNLHQEEQKRMIEYDYDQLFKRKKDNEKDTTHIQNSEIIVYKGNVFKRLITHIKRILRRIINK